jgi:penicillin-binding protein 1A
MPYNQFSIYPTRLLKMGFTLRFMRLILWLSAATICGAVLILTSAYLYINPQIPSAETFLHVDLKVPLRIYSSDGLLMQEFGERLTPISYADIPEIFVKALLDTEDKRFFQHSGVDPVTLLNASYQLLVNKGSISSGGSTITMQLVKNISGSSELRFLRKFKEILLAIKLERELTKEQILELYLNIIPFGKHAFGIQAAANVYYGKDIAALNLPQMAMLAGIPKAPEKGNPINNPARATDRRNLVLRRMLEQDSITPEQHDAAVAEPVTASVHGRAIELSAPYVGEMVRKRLLTDYGRKAYSNGYTVRTTLDSKMQSDAQRILQANLDRYDRRHGYRGPERKRLDGTDEYVDAPEYGFPSNWIKTLANTPAVGNQHAAIVIAVTDNTMVVLAKSGDEIVLEWEQLQWARPYQTVNVRGPVPNYARDIADIGDLIRISLDETGRWRLGQVPGIQGALVALDPESGAIRALAGGYDFARQQFNHALQARRQPGSIFKPFFYAGALENGLTAASIFNDAPVVLPGGQLEELYRPSNSGDKFRGNMRLREALYRSVNLVSLRVILDYGPDNAVDYVSRFGFDTSQFPRNVQLAFGGGTIALSPLEIATAYASFANGGLKVDSHLIDRIETLKGEIIYQEIPASVCKQCDELDAATKPAPRVIEPRVAYIMNTILKDVIKRGTGRKAYRELKRQDLGGKTGTTNDADIWFAGFNRKLVATTWVGFDSNDPVGSREYGSTAPLDTWIDFMRVSLPEAEDIPLPQPEGVVQVRIDPDTGLRARPSDAETIFELFREEHVPPEAPVIANQHEDDQPTKIIF